MIILNKHKIEPTYFPDKTSQIWNLPVSILDLKKFEILWEFSSESEFFHLAQLKELLDSYGGRTVLKISYLPYARQDKEISNNTTFALRPFCNLLNSLKFDEIEIVDPHSTVAINLLLNSKAIYPKEEVKSVIEANQIDLLCYPDNGASTRYSKIYDLKNIYGEKIRDQQSGKITSYKLIGNCFQKKILIVDDICDGGATFIFLTKELIVNGASQIDLFVTHGIFSNGLKQLLQSGINKIYTKKGEAFEENGQIKYKEIFK
jgi:ribose-phosphate pyrophosphokinase